MNQFLTEDELRELTGSARKKEQAEILARNGVSHSIRKDGRPMVTWHQVNHPHQMAVVSGDVPDFGALLGSDAYA